MDQPAGSTSVAATEAAGAPGAAMPEGAPRRLGFLGRLGLALCVGAQLFVFSEMIFWSRWKPVAVFGAEEGDQPAGMLLGWLLYSVLGYLLLWSAAAGRARTIWAVFLCGALYGWLDEGLLVQTMYASLPLNVSWTGLAWHATLAVLVGFHWLPRAFRARRPWAALAWSAGLGLFWGCWSIFWPNEEPHFIAPPGAYALYVTGGTLLLAASACCAGRIRPGEFRPSRWEAGLLLGAGLVYFALVTLPRTPLAAALLPPLLGLLFFSLRRNRRAEAAPLVAPATPGTPPWPNLLALAALPLVAVAVYGLAWSRGWAWPTNIAVYLVLTPLGFLMLGLSLWKVLRRAAA